MWLFSVIHPMATIYPTPFFSMYSLLLLVHLSIDGACLSSSYSHNLPLLTVNRDVCKIYFHSLSCDFSWEELIYSFVPNFKHFTSGSFHLSKSFGSSSSCYKMIKMMEDFIFMRDYMKTENKIFFILISLHSTFLCFV
jgi:hypothetical protein